MTCAPAAARAARSLSSLSCAAKNRRQPPPPAPSAFPPSAPEWAAISKSASMTALVTEGCRARWQRQVTHRTQSLHGFAAPRLVRPHDHVDDVAGDARHAGVAEDEPFLHLGNRARRQPDWAHHDVAAVELHEVGAAISCRVLVLCAPADGQFLALRTPCQARRL